MWRAQPEREVERLQARFLVRDAAAEAPAVARLAWSRVRDVVGLKVAVLCEESMKVITSAPRDVVLPKAGLTRAVSREVIPPGRRDETDRQRPSP